jgi:hypothetical protein
MDKLLENNNVLNISTHTIDAKLESLVTLEVPLLKDVFKKYLSVEGVEFYNQMSLAFPVDDFKNKDVNLKYFHNGKIVMTGCRHMQDATNTLDTFLNLIKKNDVTLKISPEICKDIQINNVRISMINTDISINGLIHGKVNQPFDTSLLQDIKLNILKTEYNSEGEYCELQYPINPKKLNSVEDSEHHKYYIPIKIYNDGKVKIKIPKYRYIKLPKPNSKMKKKRSETVKLTINDDIKPIITKLTDVLNKNISKLKIKSEIKFIDYHLPFIDYHFESEDKLRDLIMDLYEMQEDLPDEYCTYEPCTYHGLNHKYIFMDGCSAKVHDHSFLKSSKISKNKELINCKCEKGTFLAFQSGHIIMIAKTYKQIQTLFDYMRQYLIEKKDLLIF